MEEFSIHFQKYITKKSAIKLLRQRNNTFLTDIIWFKDNTATIHFSNSGIFTSSEIASMIESIDSLASDLQITIVSSCQFPDEIVYKHISYPDGTNKDSAPILKWKLDVLDAEAVKD